MKHIIISSIMATALLFNSCKSTDELDMTTVKQLDVNKYMGQWYEIARYQHHFEKDLEGVQAHYTLMDDGMIRVKNSGYKDSLGGKYKEIIGKARKKSGESAGNLEVSFFWIFYSDYKILELDSVNYSYALIGSDSDKYLWILSRTPKMKPDDLDYLLSRIADRGYDIDALYWVNQP
ncbi:MAG: lipocalin family protein [Bacteroidales bacterium]|nr:lipocalin family protein [Bacteroidales bacterium]